MYNSAAIEKYIERVNKKAEKAAQKVFSKHEKEFKRKVLAQMKKGDELNLVNGSSYFDGYGDASCLGVNEKPLTEAMDKFAVVVAAIQYPEQKATFQTYQFKK